MWVRKSVLTLLLLLCGSFAIAAEPAAAPTQVDPQKAAVIYQLLEVTGATNIHKLLMSRLIEVQKKSHPEVAPAVWDRLAAKFDANELRDRIVKIYDRHFSTADLQATLAFYQSEPGQRMLKELPAAMSEAMTEGQLWGQQKGAELQAELQAEQAHKSRLD